MQTTQFDVAVVGGGLAGLAAATYAARDGARVALFERSRTPGGRADTTTRDGFHFNRGAHALYLGGPAESALQELGVQYTGAPPDLGRYLVVRDGKFHRFVADMRSLMTTRLFNTRDRLETARVMMQLAKADLAPLASVPLSHWLDEEVRSPVVRTYIESVVRLGTFTHDPNRVSAAAAFAPFQGANVIFIDGGWKTLVDGLRTAASNAGVAVETGSRVESVEFAPFGRTSGLRLADSSRVQADAVVLAVEPSEVEDLTRGSGLSAPAAWASESEPLRAAVLDLALKRLPVPRRIAVISQDAPIYLAVHSTKARLAPAGAALVSVIRYLEPGFHNPPETVLNEMEQFADLVQPGWRELELQRQHLPSMVASNREMLASQGGAPGRPRFDSIGSPNLFVAGDWVGETGALADAVFASARLAGKAAAAAVENPAAIPVAS